MVINMDNKTYSKERADAICKIISTHTECLDILCDMYPDIMPSKSTIYDWRNNNPYFDEEFTKAKRRQGLYLGEELRGKASKKIPEEYMYTDAEGNRRIDPAYVQLRRIAIDTDKWYTSKVLPKIFGDKLQIETDEDGVMAPWIIKLQRGAPK